MRIREVANELGISTQTIRSYESRKLISAPSRTLTGFRLYSTKDVEAIRHAVERLHKGA